MPGRQAHSPSLGPVPQRSCSSHPAPRSGRPSVEGARWRVAVHCGAVRRGAARCGAAQCVAVRRGAVRCASASGWRACCLTLVRVDGADVCAGLETSVVEGEARIVVVRNVPERERGFVVSAVLWCQRQRQSLCPRAVWSHPNCDPEIIPCVKQTHADAFSAISVSRLA